MKPRLPRELGDALLLAAGVITLALFVVLYAMLPSTSIEVKTVAQGTEPQTTTQGR
jgi:hypothetical protein